MFTHKHTQARSHCERIIKEKDVALRTSLTQVHGECLEPHTDTSGRAKAPPTRAQWVKLVGKQKDLAGLSAAWV